MIAFLEGRFLAAEADAVVLAVNGVGFRVFVSPELIGRLPAIGETVRLYTHLVVKEDALELFGLGSEAERAAFLRLLGVSGIGPRTALAAVGRLGPQRLWQAIVQEDTALLCAVPGVGKKTARRMIVELKDQAAQAEAAPAGGAAGLSSAVGDAVAALIALGYGTGEALDAVTAVAGSGGDDAGQDTAELVKKALQRLGRT
ncbi:MAG: Holliday junction branch migration protein RuvA [Thermoanaerobacterales bacterium]|nr:Holliday junction branch migration protein RuvA [Thermoanaerobacterales bacterium]